MRLLRVLRVAKVTRALRIVRQGCPHHAIFVILEPVYKCPFATRPVSTPLATQRSIDAFSFGKRTGGKHQVRARRHLLSDRVVKFVRSLKSLLFCIGRTLRALAAWQHYVKFCGKTHTGGNNIKQNFACVEFLSELKSLNLNLLDPQILTVTCMCTKCVGTLRFCPPNGTDATEYVWNLLATCRGPCLLSNHKSHLEKTCPDQGSKSQVQGSNRYGAPTCM